MKRECHLGRDRVSAFLQTGDGALLKLPVLGLTSNTRIPEGADVLCPISENGVWFLPLLCFLCFECNRGGIPPSLNPLKEWDGLRGSGF